MDIFKLDPRKVFFVNAWVDGFFIVGATLIIAFLSRLTVAFSPRSASQFMMAAYYFSWFVNWPHFSATSYRLYQNKSNLKQFPITSYVIPFIVVTSVFAALFSPDVVAPYYMKLFSLWSPYHFAAQTLGITLIYARRTDFQMGKWERMSLTGFVLGTYLTQTSRFEVGSGYHELLSIKYPVLGIPDWMPMAAKVYMYLALAVFAILVIRQGLRTGRWLKWPVLMPLVAQQIWFTNVDYESFQALVPFLHSLQYLLIAWSMQMQVSSSANQSAPHVVAAGESAQGFWRHLFWPSSKWALANGAGGAMMFLGFPAICAGLGWPYAFANAIAITGVQFHHFFVDGVIWKIRDQSIASPLLRNVRDALPLAAQSRAS